MTNPLRIGTLISGGGTNLEAIIDSCQTGTLQAQILFTGTDNPQAKGLERAKKASIDTFIVEYSQILSQYRQHMDDTKLPNDFDMDDILSKQRILPPDTPREKKDFFFKSRAIAEKQLLDHIRQYEMDLLVLAGFMRILTPYFIDRINQGEYRIMNIHPALLPSFPGTDGYGDTFRYGCKIGGCTVHFVDYGEDSGPIIGQKAFEINDTDTLEQVRKKGLAKEWELYPACIAAYSPQKIL